MVDIQSEKDPEVLRQVAGLLDAENRRLHTKLRVLIEQVAALQSGDTAKKQLELELLRLQESLALREHALFGDKTERRAAIAGSLKPVVKSAASRSRGRRPQPALPTVDQVWKLDAADEMCPKCGGGLREMKDQFEEAEEIDIVQRQFVMVKHKRQKYRCSCNACVETATGPVKLRAGSRYSVDFAVEVAVSKYLDHLPLERQSRIMRREGLAVQSSTLWDQLDALAQVLSPAHERLHDSVLEQPVIGADETFWRLMDKRGRNKGVAKRWQAWTICAPRAVVYRIQDSRSTQAAADILRDYDGIVIADGYTAYESLVKRGGRFTLANCWAHARRKYVEVEKFYPTEVAEILDLIGELYGIERVCSTGPPGAEQLELRRTLRDERSRAVIKRIECWALDQRALPQSGLGRGIGYMSGLWKGLTRFLDDPRIPLDNNATERSLRGMVVGRKNHYGSKSRRGTEVAALFYSLLESAKLADVEPKLYLRTATAAALGGDTIPLPHEIS